MALAEQKIYTVEDIYHLPDGQRAELIDGKMYMMTPPSFKHQDILSELHYLSTALRGCRNTGWSITRKIKFLSMIFCTIP